MSRLFYNFALYSREVPPEVELLYGEALEYTTYTVEPEIRQRLSKKKVPPYIADLVRMLIGREGLFLLAKDMSIDLDTFIMHIRYHVEAPEDIERFRHVANYAHIVVYSDKLEKIPEQLRELDYVAVIGTAALRIASPKTTVILLNERAIDPGDDELLRQLAILLFRASRYAPLLPEVAADTVYREDNLCPRLWSEAVKLYGLGIGQYLGIGVVSGAQHSFMREILRLAKTIYLPK